MIKITVGDQLIEEAKEEAQKMGIPLNSITDGKGSTAGFVGKHMVAYYLGITEGLQFKTYNYDMVKNGKRIQVKTKRCTSPPFPSYECSISDYNPDQICDYYVFVRVLNNMREGWILGYMPRDEYFKRAKTYEKGDYDSENGFIFKCRTYNLPISELYDIRDLANDPTHEDLTSFF